QTAVTAHRRNPRLALGEIRPQPDLLGGAADQVGPRPPEVALIFGVGLDETTIRGGRDRGCDRTGFEGGGKHLFRLAQGDFGLLAFGDVGIDPDRGAIEYGLRVERPSGLDDPDAAAVAAPHLQFEIGKAIARQLRIANVATCLELLFRTVKYPCAVAFDFRRAGKPEHHGDTLVAFQYLALLQEQDTDVGVIENQALLVEQFLDPVILVLALGDVADDGLQTRLATIVDAAEADLDVERR